MKSDFAGPGRDQVAPPEGKPPLPLYRLEGLVIGILHFRRVRNEARPLLTRAHLNRPGEEHLGLLLDIAYEVGDKYPDRELLPYRVLIKRVSDYFQTEGHALSREVGAHLLRTPEDCADGDGDVPGLLWTAYREIRPGEITVEDEIETLGDLMRERELAEAVRVHALRAGAGGLKSFDGLLDEFRRRKDRIDALTADADGEIYEGFATADDAYEAIEVMPTFITPIDGYMNGGHAAGEIYGFLAGTGRGKSTLMTQIATGSARACKGQARGTALPCRHAYVFSFEDNGNKMRSRSLSHTANIDKDRIMAMRNPEKDLSRAGNLEPYEHELIKKGVITPEQGGEYERFREAQAYYDNVHFIDMCKGGRGDGGPDEVAALVRRAVERNGWLPGVVIIDSLDLLVKRHLLAKNLDPDRYTRRAMIDYVFQVRKVVAVEFATPVWVTNQLAAAKTKSNETIAMDHTEAAEAKQWANALDFAFTMGALSTAKVGLFNCTKSRRTGEQDKRRATLLQLQGEFGRWVPADNFVIANGEIVPRSLARDFQGATARPRPPKSSAAKVSDGADWDVDGSEIG